MIADAEVGLRMDVVDAKIQSLVHYDAAGVDIEDMAYKRVGLDREQDTIGVHKGCVQDGTVVAGSSQGGSTLADSASVLDASSGRGHCRDP